MQWNAIAQIINWCDYKRADMCIATRSFALYYWWVKRSNIPHKNVNYAIKRDGRALIKGGYCTRAKSE